MTRSGDARTPEERRDLRICAASPTKSDVNIFKVILEMPVVYYITNEETKCEIKWIAEWSTSLSVSNGISTKLII